MLVGKRKYFEDEPNEVYLKYIYEVYEFNISFKKKNYIRQKS